MKKTNQGFSLIELMVALAIVAILTSIAMPMYSDSLRRGYRQDAKVALFLAAQKMEQQYTLTNYYANNVADADALLLAWGLSSASEGKYTIAFHEVSQTEYILKATAVAEKGQHLDKGDEYDCSILYLDYRSLRGTAKSKGIDNRANSTQLCWGK